MRCGACASWDARPWGNVWADTWTGIPARAEKRAASLGVKPALDQVIEAGVIGAVRRDSREPCRPARVHFMSLSVHDREVV